MNSTSRAVRGCQGDSARHLLLHVFLCLLHLLLLLLRHLLLVLLVLLGLELVLVLPLVLELPPDPFSAAALAHACRTLRGDAASAAAAYLAGRGSNLPTRRPSRVGRRWWPRLSRWSGLCP